MHRNRTWSFVSPVWRLSHNRTLNADGFIPALDYIYWSPQDFAILSTLTVLGPIADPITINQTYQPIRLKWVASFGTLPRGTRIYYRKNGGSWVQWNTDIFTAVTFTDGDIFELGAQTSTSFGIVSFALFNGADNLQCSETFTLSVV